MADEQQSRDPEEGVGGPEERIQFQPGTNSATLQGAVVRGTHNRYVLTARAGQAMSVEVTSVEPNAVITILQPDGQAIPGTEAGQDRTIWNGLLPLSGDYQIIVGSTRGNATYTLTVRITD